MKKIKNPAFVALYEQFRREIQLAGKQPKTNVNRLILSRDF